MFDNLSEKLDKALHNLKGHGKITEINIAETLKEVRRALLDADVNFKIAQNTRSITSDITKSLPGRYLGVLCEIVRSGHCDMVQGCI